VRGLADAKNPQKPWGGQVLNQNKQRFSDHGEKQEESEERNGNFEKQGKKAEKRSRPTKLPFGATRDPNGKKEQLKEESFAGGRKSQARREGEKENSGSLSTRGYFMISNDGKGTTNAWREPPKYCSPREKVR